MKLAIRLIVGASLITPLFAFAQTGINTTYLQGYSSSIIGVINLIIVPVLMAVAFIVFLYGVYKYFIYGAESDTERATGRQFVLWGIIGFVIITSVWALVNIVTSTLGLGSANAPAPPTFGGSSAPKTAPSTNPVPNLGNNTCLAYGPGTGCITSSGVSGVCDSSNVCQPK